ncbi:MAG: LLM class flavin-dependent oxidoreductase [Dehalococcoidia bacterium]|nr:LLM class flavin-dependent oxidoreductase [Dehalococcoidia bacterium]
MKIGVGLSRNAPDDWASAAHFAIEAERLGADSIWAAETWGFDGATPLAYIAAHTSSLLLGTSILQIGARTPALTAMTAMSLASMSGDRFVLGLGLSTPQIIEGWHGVPFDRPVVRTRELIEIIRLISARERLDFHGAIYNVPLNDARVMRFAAQPRHLPIYVASVGPQMLRTTGALADGWIGNCFLPERAHFYLDHLRAGAQAAGRSLADLELQVPVTLEFGDDIEELTKRHARGYAFTFGAMGTPRGNFYVEAFARQGFEAVRDVERLWLDGRRDEAEDLVPVEIGERTNLLGTPDLIKARLRAYRDAGITSLRVGLRGDDVDARLADLARLLELVRDVEAEAPAPAPNR